MINNEVKSVTTNNHYFENYGWCFIVVGSLGSGKSYFIKNKLLGNGKIFDIDALRERYKKYLRLNGQKLPNFKDLQVISGQKIQKSEKIFLNSQGENKGNIIFDLAGRPGKRGEASQLEQIVRLVKPFGYKIAVIWVVTNRSVAMKRNIERGLSRERAVIPDKSFHQRTNQTNKFMPNFMQSEIVGIYADLAYIVFSSSDSLKDMTNFEKQNCVYQLKKEGNRFIIGPHLMDNITKVLGPKETSNKFTPETYKTNAEVKSILRKGETPINYLKNSSNEIYENKNKRIVINEQKLIKLINETIKKVLRKYGLIN